MLLLLLSAGCINNDEKWTALFNGKDLEGWHAYGQQGAPDGWFVENGELHFDFKKKSGTGGANLVTDQEYSNFELSFEWNIGVHGNSGVFWAVVEDPKYEHPYQTGPEIQILDDNWKEYIEGRGDINRAGSLYGLLPPSKIVSKPAGEWNHFLVHIDHKNNKGFLKFNDEKVVEFPVNGPEWEALIANSHFADWPGFGKATSGKICLQEYGGKVAFRNIKIRELPE